MANNLIGLGLLGLLLTACGTSEPTVTPAPIRAAIPTATPRTWGGLESGYVWLFGTPTATATVTWTATPGASSTPTQTPTPINAETLKGKLLFLSSRPLPAAYRVETNLRGLTNPDILKALRASNAGVVVWKFEPSTYQVMPCDPPPATPTPTLSPSMGKATPSLLFGNLESVFQRGATACQRVYDEANQAKTFSPDKRYEVYVGADPNGGRPQIWVMDHHAQNKKMLTRFGAGVSYDPAFAPDGYRIVFVSQEAGQDNLYTITRDGTELKRLTRIAGQDWTTMWEWVKRPVWSTDGAQIAFWSNRVSGTRQIWVMNADGTNLHTISNDPRPYEDWEPVWVR